MSSATEISLEESVCHPSDAPPSHRFERKFFSYSFIHFRPTAAVVVVCKKRQGCREVKEHHERESPEREIARAVWAVRYKSLRANDIVPDPMVKTKKVMEVWKEHWELRVLG